ncbi:MAG: BlaI/MecI/CopY family transcriptional regulator [Candidatus Shapirobacteria bacterium]|jgi:predicted transcriptional regulator
MKRLINTQVVDGKLETSVMEIVWNKKRCSPREVLVELKNKYALTTISTVLERLYLKKILVKNKIDGKVTFSPKISQEAYSDSVVKQFMNKAMTSFGDIAVSSFAKGVEQLPDNKRKELVELLKKYER